MLLIQVRPDGGGMAVAESHLLERKIFCEVYSTPVHLIIIMVQVNARKPHVRPFAQMKKLMQISV